MLISLLHLVDRWRFKINNVINGLIFSPQIFNSVSHSTTFTWYWIVTSFDYYIYTILYYMCLLEFAQRNVTLTSVIFILKIYNIVQCLRGFKIFAYDDLSTANRPNYPIWHSDIQSWILYWVWRFQIFIACNSRNYKYME